MDAPTTAPLTVTATFSDWLSGSPLCPGRPGAFVAIVGDGIKVDAEFNDDGEVLRLTGRFDARFIAADDVYGRAPRALHQPLPDIAEEALRMGERSPFVTESRWTIVGGEIELVEPQQEAA